MIAYLDTSAALKLIVQEAESKALSRYLQDEAAPAGFVLTASWLLHTELHCATRRQVSAVDRTKVQDLLDLVDLVDVTRIDLTAASSASRRLRAADAIHLASALRVGAETMITYDGELLEAARDAGLAVVAPS